MCPALPRLVLAITYSCLLHFTLFPGLRKEPPPTPSTGSSEPEKSICLVSKYFSGLWVQGQMLNCRGPSKTISLPGALPERAAGFPLRHLKKKKDVNSIDCTEIKMTWLKSILTKINDFLKRLKMLDVWLLHI